MNRDLIEALVICLDLANEHVCDRCNPNTTTLEQETDQNQALTTVQHWLDGQKRFFGIKSKINSHSRLTMTS